MILITISHFSKHNHYLESLIHEVFILLKFVFSPQKETVKKHLLADFLCQNEIDPVIPRLEVLISFKEYIYM